MNEEIDPEAQLRIVTRPLNSDEKRVCSKCGKTAVQEVIVGSKLRMPNYYCSQHSVAAEN